MDMRPLFSASGPVAAVALALALVASTGCKPKNDKPAESPAATTSATPASNDDGCRQGVGDDLKTAGRTAGAGAKTGLTTAADGIVQAGSAAAGLVQGGTSEAKQRWNEGGTETKSTARKGASETREAAGTPRCSNR